MPVAKHYFCHTHLIRMSTDHYTYVLDVCCEILINEFFHRHLIHVSTEHYTYGLDVSCEKLMNDCFATGI